MRLINTHNAATTIRKKRRPWVAQRIMDISISTSATADLTAAHDVTTTIKCSK
jgi:hypothetical protein